MSLIPFDLVGWAAKNVPPEPAPQKAAPRKAGKQDNRLTAYAAAALEREAAEVAAAPAGNRNNRLNKAACALGEFVSAGQLSRVEVEQALTQAARSIGLGEMEIARTIESGLSHGMNEPRPLDELANRPRLPPPRNAAPGGAAPAGGQAAGELAEQDEGPGCLPGFEDNPHRLARMFLSESFSHPDGSRLRFWEDEFHVWEDGAYRLVSNKEMRVRASKAIEAEYQRIYHAQLIQSAMADDKAKPPRPISVTTAATGNVLEALGSLSLLSKAKYPHQPCWLDGDDPWPISECVPMANGIIHLPSYVEGKPCHRKPTPRFFAPHVLAYDFEPDAPEPAEWLRFLNQLWPDDPQSIETLQEWMGLQLVPDTSFEKMMALIGPTRAGKGTIAEIMIALVGEQNCAGPTLSLLASDFGLAPLIGKLSAIIDDARLSPKSDQAMIAERLLTISGQGTLTFDRKHRSAWTGRLGCRITLISNELPRLTDASSALPNRFIVLRFTESFLGREDKGLKPRLRKELPGIFKWAIEGWRRLRERGYLIQPESGNDEIAMMKELASPISTFLEDCADIGPDKICRCSDGFRAWRQWCEENGRKDVGDQPKFGRDLRSAIPSLRTKQRREEGWRGRCFFGFALKTPGEFLGGQTVHNGPNGGFIFDEEDSETPF